MKMSSLCRIAYVLFVSFYLLSIPNSFAQKKKKKKGKITTPIAKKDKSAFKKISDVTKKYKKIDGLFPIYQDTTNGAIKLVVNEQQIGKEYIYFSQIANGVSENRGLIKGNYRESKVFKIEKYFNKIEFITQNTSSYFDPEKALSKSASTNLSEGVMASLKIEAVDKEKGLFLIDGNALFLKETFSQVKPSRRPGQKPSSFSLGNLSKEKTQISSIRNYPQNTDLAIKYVYSKGSALSKGSRAVSDGRNVSVKVFHSLIDMPENNYEVLFDDPRVGFFATQVTDMTSASPAPYRDLVHRWHLEKKDPSALLSEPVEPIVWWMENTTPVAWRETIKNAVLQWNIAFEKAGFKNAMVVKMQPDTATWDAGDIRYNVLRWTSSPRPFFGGFGPSFTNPRTGQILGSDIMLEFAHFTNRVMYDKVFDFNNHENNSLETEKTHYCSQGHIMHENSMFGSAVLKASGDSDFEMKRLKKEAMTSLIMHEVGHTLGLNHNMKASHLFSPAQLADAKLIEGKCLSGSVMDYSSINLTIDKSKQGQYYDVTIGPYDIWAIQFGYTPFKNLKEKESLLNRSTNPELIFGNDADDMRSPGKAIDPRVMVGDLSNDPMTYSENIFSLVNNTLKEIKTNFSKKGASYEELRRAYFILSKQRSNASNVVSRFIGGVYVDRAMIGQEGETKPYTPVSFSDQKRAMNILEKYVFSPNAFDAPNDLYNYLAQQRRGYNFFRGPEDPKIHNQVLTYQTTVLAHLLHYNTLQRIIDSELYGNKYALSEMMTDLNEAIFKADIYGNVNSFRQNLQIAYTKKLISMVVGPSSNRYIANARSLAIYNLKKINKIAKTNTGNTITKAHRLHLNTLITNTLKEVK